MNLLNLAYLALIAVFYLFLCRGTAGGSSNSRSAVGIGAILDVGSRVGREEKTAIEIALHNFNTKSSNTRHNFSVYFRDPQSDPLKAAYAAEGLIKTQKVEAIVGMHTWAESAMVGEVGSRAQIPLLSLSPSSISAPLKQLRWPFLINLAGSNGSEEIQCIAALVRFYSWKRVVVIYEDDAYGGNSGKLDLLAEALQKSDSEIEHRLIFPPYNSLVNGSKELVRDELIGLFRKQSRVFIVLQASLPMAIDIFREAKSVGLSGRDSAWIVTEGITSLLDSVEDSVISSMEGTLGIKRDFPNHGGDYENFKSQFRGKFRSEYPEEDNLVPGIHALRAYDGIRAIAEAAEKRKTGEKIMLSGNFTGLSGEICLTAGGEPCPVPLLRVVNVVGRSYRELDFWLPGFGFSKTRNVHVTEEESGLSGTVMWPGDLVDRPPTGWAMPTDSKPLRIVIPKRTSFEKFASWPDGKKRPEGYCISLFDKVLRQLNYALPHEYFCYDGPYDDLIQGVYNQTYDAAVGDITILADRYKYVDFTQPFTESGLSTIVPSSPDDSAWMFTKPFDFKMWTMCLALLAYTIVVVWFMEHNSNPEFQGPWNAQLGTALWFIFCSLFFVQKEKINNNITRVAVVVWFCVVFILTQSYTASLTSMLTVKRLGPDFEILKQNKLYVGCDNDSFVKNYLETVLDFQPDRIRIFDNESQYTTAFETKEIAAAFLEIPYEKIFINKHCGEYTTTRASNRFGGFGFAFQKGSPIARDFSEAILSLSEDGTLRKLEEEWFGPVTECPTSDKLTLHSFVGLFSISAGTSTMCLIIFLIRLKRHGGKMARVHDVDEEETGSLAGEDMGSGSGKPGGPTPSRAVTFPAEHGLSHQWWRSTSCRWRSVGSSDPVEEASPAVIEMPKF
ncbi:unnamed protein product [Linum trigynum]|uniref:Glutamate receptor n=1 Tax=Linum trigynum TaxID=586398 RepID=A0AAV2ER78_9ROSI